MKIEFEIKPENVRALTLFLVSLVLGWVLSDLRTRILLVEAIDTNARLTTVVDRQQVANQVCIAKVEGLYVWLASAHDGEVGYPAVERR